MNMLQVSVAGMCRDSGLLFQCGALTQAGSAGGALLMFLLVNQVEKEILNHFNININAPRLACFKGTMLVVEANKRRKEAF